MKRSLLALLAIFLLTACDPEGRKKCAWILEPEPELRYRVDPGFVPVCARNRQTMKQDCRLQTSLEFAKSTNGKTFRYVDMKVNSKGVPRTIESIDFCIPQTK